ncbi:histidine phosphatase-like, putative [Bodo saltans]|uniref:Histidine phosphatase-like, putative n=1 Tax=Bodo saltans TaxID=75058 RepID=A0A0S4JHT5_BODSA|nr:histidine phosphatase-like, putative [Bodo saltans]|eukprot:CUG89021.1 histidine phosphatase-like, putative [Bodo saltans]
MEFLFIRHGESHNNVLRETLREEHGRPNDEVLFRRQRLHDPALTQLGKTQVLAVAQRVQQEYPRMHELWVSFLSRALGTAAAVHAALPHTRVLVMTDINECGGSYRYCHDKQGFVTEPGVSRSQVTNEYPTFEFFTPTQPESDHDGWYSGSGKETHEQSHQRAVQLIARIESAVAMQLQQHQGGASSDQRPGSASSSSSPGNTLGVTPTSDHLNDDQAPLVGVVTHGDFFRLFLSELLRTNRIANTDIDIVDRIRRGKDMGGAGASDAWVQNTAITRFQVKKKRDAPENNNSDASSGDNATAMEWHIALFADAAHLNNL